MAWTSFGVSNVCEALKTQKNPRHAPCPQKIEPDSRGLVPGIHVLATPKKDVDGRDEARP